jgi:hypothetical protein
MLCLECVALDTVHSLGVAGAGARRDHGKRLERHHTRVRTAHPRLGGLIEALRDDPAHVCGVVMPLLCVAIRASRPRAPAGTPAA